MKFYTKEDKLFEMICSDYQLLNIISRFGMNLGFGEKSIEEICEENNIDWATTHHTGEPVPVYAVGKGAEKFIGRMDNTDIKGKILGK